MSPQQHRNHLMREVEMLERELRQRQQAARSLPKSVFLAYQQLIASKHALLQRESTQEAT